MPRTAWQAKSQRASANQIYKEYISFKQHFHMNATVWETLTDFVMYLGRTGKCEVDETEKGWFLTYIDRDPEKLRQMEARLRSLGIGHGVWSGGARGGGGGEGGRG